jgi:hypothetical protein
MTALNPAIDAFVQEVAPEKIWAEVLIQLSGEEFILRHVRDRGVPTGELKQLTFSDLRKLSFLNAAGLFRPLRSSPDLQSGWVLSCSGATDLWRALQEIYPGSVADWFAVQNGASPTEYRQFTNRQSGMYRITQLLSDAQAAWVTRAACSQRFCLKRRLWTVAGLDADAAVGKSEIPCLEPCAVLLELARKCTRIEQEEKLGVQLSRSEMESFLAAAEIVIGSGLAGERVGNVSAPTNPRRLQLLLEKFKEALIAADKSGAEE